MPGGDGGGLSYSVNAPVAGSGSPSGMRRITSFHSVDAAE